MWMNDILVTSDDLVKISEVKQYLHNKFTKNDLDNANYFLRIEIVQSDLGLLVSQHKYIMDIWQEANMIKARPCPTPIPVGYKLRRKEDNF